VESILQEILKGIPIFSGLEASDYSKIARLAYKRHYRSQEIIFREKHPGAGMYVIQEGMVEIIKGLQSGGRHILVVLGDGDFFGELALLDSEPRSATAVAARPTDIIGIFRPDLMDLVKREPRLGVKILMNMVRFISSRLRKTSLKLLEEGRGLPL
jgi:CRP-like cAMP-binding protein